MDMRQGILQYQRRDGSIATVTPADLASESIGAGGVNQAALKLHAAIPGPQRLHRGRRPEPRRLPLQSARRRCAGTPTSPRCDYILDNANKHTLFVRGNLQNDNETDACRSSPGAARTALSACATTRVTPSA